MAIKKLLVVGDSFMHPDQDFPGQHWSEMLPEYEIIMRSISGSSNGMIAYQFVQGLKLNPDAVVMGFTMPDRIEFRIPPGRLHYNSNRIWYSSGNSELDADQRLAVDIFRATTDDVMNRFKSMLMAKSMFLECERRRLPYAVNYNGLHGANLAYPTADPIIQDIVDEFSSRRCTNLNGHVFKMHPGFHNDDPVCQQRMATEVRDILSTVDFD
jgi:hypothetical protein